MAIARHRIVNLVFCLLTVIRRCVGAATNFFCQDCVLCWHVEHGWTEVVDPETCPGCRLGTTACVERWGIIPRTHHHGLGWGDIESELYGSAREACSFAFRE